MANWILAAGIVAFVGIASAFLLWDGLAAQVEAGHAAARQPWRTRAELAAGAVGVALALWLALGLLTHAH